MITAKEARKISKVAAQNDYNKHKELIGADLKTIQKLVELEARCSCSKHGDILFVEGESRFRGDGWKHYLRLLKTKVEEFGFKVEESDPWSDAPDAGYLKISW